MAFLKKIKDKLSSDTTTDLTVSENDSFSYSAENNTFEINGKTYGTVLNMATSTGGYSITSNSVTNSIPINNCFPTTAGTVAYPPYTHPTTWHTVSGGWSTNWGDITLPSSDEVAQTTVYPTPLNVVLPVHAAHYNLWKDLNPDVPHRFCAMYETSTTVNNARQLCFLEAEHYENFRTFWLAYEQRFEGNVLEAYYPHPKSHGAVHIILAVGNMVEQWRWIVEHCSEPVRNGGGYWFFDSESDKTKFMLKWTD